MTHGCDDKKLKMTAYIKEGLTNMKAFLIQPILAHVCVRVSLICIYIYIYIYIYMFVGSLVTTLM